MRAFRRVPLIVMAVLILGTAGCNGGSEETTTAPPVEPTTDTAAPTTGALPTTTEASTTEPPPTSTAATTATTIAAPTTAATTTVPPTSTVAVYVYTGGFPPVLDGPLGAHGSGCSPGAGPLPDGIWFGFPEAWTTTSIDFDLACFYTGDAATAEAAARGEESPPPNDYIITNDNPALRAVPVSGGAIGHRLDSDVETYPVPFADFIADPGEFQDCPAHCLMWLYVNGGAVTEIVSQYVP